ncbi:MAG: YXWGXW repeat-containing protein [Terracidiphilus sp.]
MKVLHSVRWLLLALVLTLIPVSAHAGVFISVGIAPPPLVEYDQPFCPGPNMIWTPGYWAYGPDGYYWVPGEWVPAPFPEALWTPPYWGWSDGFYVFHPGYWGYQVGYYGGVNYGFGYGGIGFVGGRWRGNSFFYNTAVMHVNRRFIRTTYVDRRIVERGYVARGSHVSYSGGPGGIQYQPGAAERMAANQRHFGATSFQSQHESAARSDQGSYFRNNGNNGGRQAAPQQMGRQWNSSPQSQWGKNQNQQWQQNQNQQWKQNQNQNQNQQWQQNQNQQWKQNQNQQWKQNQNQQWQQNQNQQWKQNQNQQWKQNQNQQWKQNQNQQKMDTRPAPRVENRPGMENRPAPRNEGKPESHPQPRDENGRR